MDVSGTNSDKKIPVSSAVLSAGAVKAKPSNETKAPENTSYVDVSVDSVVNNNGDANDAVKALTRGLRGVVDLYVTSEPSRKPPLKQEAKELAQQLSKEIQSRPTSEPIDDKLAALAQTLASIFGNDSVPPPGVAMKDFILSVLTRVSKTSTANNEVREKALENSEAEKEIASENVKASKVSVEDVDDLVSKITAAVSNKSSLFNAIKAPNTSLLG